MDDKIMPQITVFSTAGKYLSKVIGISGGALTKNSSNCKMPSGRAFRRELRNSQEFADLIAELGVSNAIALGRMNDGIGDEIEITVAGREGYLPGGPISRSAQFFSYSEGKPAYMLIDLDTKGAPVTLSRSWRTQVLRRSLPRWCPRS
ncbi:MAG: hypothetical protein WCF85_19030 [Rhodospirillaceae bacterium]